MTLTHFKEKPLNDLVGYTHDAKGNSINNKKITGKMWRVRTDLHLLAYGLKRDRLPMGEPAAWARVIADVIQFCRTKRHHRVDAETVEDLAGQIGVKIKMQDVWDAVDAVSQPLQAKTAKNQPYLPLAGMTIAKMLGVTKAM